MNKMKLLVRSHALREAASPPPDTPCPAPAVLCDDQDVDNPSTSSSLVITVVESNDDDDDDDEALLHPIQESAQSAQLANRLRPRVQVNLKVL